MSDIEDMRASLGRCAPGHLPDTARPSENGVPPNHVAECGSFPDCLCVSECRDAAHQAELREIIRAHAARNARFERRHHEAFHPAPKRRS